MEQRNKSNKKGWRRFFDLEAGGEGGGGGRHTVNRTRQALARMLTQSEGRPQEAFKAVTGSLLLLSGKWAKDKEAPNKDKAGEYTEMNEER